MYLWLPMDPGGSTAVLGKKEGIRDSWQWGISCVHIHRACWRLEDRAKMRLEAYSMCSHCTCTHTQAHTCPSHTRTASTGTNTKHSSWPSPRALPPPLSNRIVPHAVKNRRRKERKKNSSFPFPMFTCFLWVSQLHNTREQTGRDPVKN